MTFDIKKFTTDLSNKDNGVFSGRTTARYEIENDCPVIRIQNARCFQFIPRKEADTELEASIMSKDSTLITSFDDQDPSTQFKDHFFNTLLPGFLARTMSIDFEKAVLLSPIQGTSVDMDIAAISPCTEEFLSLIVPDSDGILNYSIVLIAKVTGKEYSVVESFFDTEELRITDMEGVSFSCGAALFYDDGSDGLVQYNPGKINQ